ncbi:MAG: GTP cyclohydrolase FolE2, partial [Planctomycetota bacterium]
SEVAQTTVGNWQLHVSLSSDERGTHMSRFMEILSESNGQQTLDSLGEMCDQIRQRLDSEDAWLTVDFPWFIDKPAPITGALGKLDMDAQIAVCRGAVNQTTFTIRVPATSLCPCSKKISDYGAHNQRCEMIAAVRFVDNETISIEELFSMVEQAASAQVFPIIKREDEKRVTEQAWENPKFVEDSVRDLAKSLSEDARISWFRCSSENFESIHNHNAYAEIEIDKNYN